MNSKTDPGLFENPITFPDPVAKERFDSLIALDDQKNRLTKILSILVNPVTLKNWIAQYHPDADVLLDSLFRRPPLVILAGDVGSGKTELAETVGDAVARSQNIDVLLLSLSLSSRGQGRVGEMTQLISSAFDYTISEGTKLKSQTGKHRGGLILLIDEADALAQSREATQMHHEDRAGVNALIRGISRLANAKLPAAVIMCTNRLGALDPAVKRRAADILVFKRPDDKTRQAVLETLTKPLGLSAKHISELASLTGANPERPYGFTFSDLTQRLIPTIILDALPHKPIQAARALEIAKTMLPTPPFEEGRK